MYIKNILTLETLQVASSLKVIRNVDYTCSCIKTIDNFCTGSQVRPTEFIEFSPTLWYSKQNNSTAV